MEQHDFDISNEMVDRFSSLARTGNPNVEPYSKWNTYSKKEDTYIWE